MVVNTIIKKIREKLMNALKAYVSVRTRFVTNLTVLDSHVKRPRQCHLQSVGLKGQALIDRRWVFRGVRIQLSFLHPWSLFPGGGLGASGFWPFFPALNLCTYLFIIQSVLIDPSPPLVSQVGAYFCIHPITRPLLLSISCVDRSLHRPNVFSH